MATDPFRTSVPADVQSHVIEHLAYSEKQRLRAVSPAFLHAALTARYTSSRLRLGYSARKLDVVNSLRRLRRLRWVPHITPLVRSFSIVGPARSCVPDLPIGEIVDELPDILAALPNLSALFVQWREIFFADQMSSVLSRGWPDIAPRLTRLHVQIDLAHLPELVALGPRAAQLTDLGLSVHGDSSHATTERTWEALATNLVIPSASTLVHFNLEIYVRARRTLSCVPPFVDGRPLHDARTGPVFSMLADTHFPRLRGLYVTAPFNGALTQDEDASLLHFVCAHPQLGDLAVLPSPVNTTHTRGGMDYQFGPGYGRFLRGAVGHVSHFSPCLKRLALCAGSTQYGSRASERGWVKDIMCILSGVAAPLEQLIITGLRRDAEVTEILHTLHGHANSVRMLRLDQLDILNQPLLETMLDALPTLSYLDIRECCVCSFLKSETPVTLTGRSVLLEDARNHGRLRAAPGTLVVRQRSSERTHHSDWEPLDLLPFRSP